MIAEGDKNGDKKLDFKEFKAMMVSEREGTGGGLLFFLLSLIMFVVCTVLLDCQAARINLFGRISFQLVSSTAQI